MKAPVVPDDESERLAALAELGLLDTPPEERFDRITRTVARLLDAPIALLNLVDADRQWSKSAVGFEQGGQADRSISFCAHVVGDGRPVFVPDTLDDLRFHDNPQVTDDPPALRCYFGVPVHGPSGHVVGSFCIAGHEPRELTADQVAVLEDLVTWVEAELDRGRLAELTLKERVLRQRLEAINASVGDAILVFDGDGTVTDINAAATELTGYPSSGLIGADVAWLLPETTAEQLLDRLWDRGPLDHAVTEEIELVDRQGQHIPVELTISTTAEGDAYVVAARDIRERHRHAQTMELLRRRYEVILDVAADAIIGIARDGTVDYSNPAAEDLFGVERDGLLGTDLHARYHAHYPDGRPYPWPACPTARTLVEGIGHTAVDEVFYRADGRAVEVEYSATPIMHGEVVTGAVMVVRDVAARREVERLKEEFVSTVSHELRTPLSSIKGALSLVRGGVVGEVAPEARELLDVAHGSTDRLIRLVNDLLDLTRLDNGQVELDATPTTLRVIADGAIAAVGQSAAAAGVQLVCEVPPVPLVVDGDRVVQALTNLLGNAVRFSPAGGTVHLCATVHPDTVVLDVRDEGRGVPAEAVHRIFERFGQADASDARERSGTGLGLPIARELVERHGGRLWLGTSDVGALFHLELPRPAHGGDDPWITTDHEADR